MGDIRQVREVKSTTMQTAKKNICIVLYYTFTCMKQEDEEREAFLHGETLLWDIENETRWQDSAS